MRPSQLLTTPRTSEAREPDNESLVLRTLRATDEHPTAGELYDAVRLVRPHIGRATIYRALERLVASGQAVEVARDSAGRRYDARVERHDHCVCAGCGRVIDLTLPPTIPAVTVAQLAELAARAGFAMDAYELRIRGLCADCQSDQSDESDQFDQTDDSRLDDSSPAHSPASRSPRRYHPHE